MALLDDIMKTLDRWERWRTVNATPERVDELEQRVEELEIKLGVKWPADVCPACSKRALRFSFILANTDKGTATEFWTCESCEREIKRPIKAR